MGVSGSRRLGRLAKAPLRALGRVCDWYVRSVTSCAAAHSHYGAAVAYPAAIAPLPGRFRFVSDAGFGGGGDDGDLRELIRVTSAARARAGAVRRSRSVGMGRIDEEEEPCESGSSDGGGVGSGLRRWRKEGD